MSDTGSSSPPGQSGSAGGSGDSSGQPPPSGDQGSQDGGKGDGGKKQTSEELLAALEAERRYHKETQGKLVKLEKERMSETEKAIAEAKKAGHDEAILVAGKRLAAAEFRAAAAGRLTDPSATLELLDLSKYVGDDGEPDTKAIAAVVEKLAAGLAPATPPNGRVPAGPRGGTDPAAPTDSWLRDSIIRH